MDAGLFFISSALKERIELEPIPGPGVYIVPTDPFLVCHFPYADDGDDRYPEYRPKDEGLPLLHGHVHSRWQQRGNMLNVSMDAHQMRLLSSDDVLGWFY